MSDKRILVTCRALSTYLADLAGPRVEMEVLDIGLHIRPELLRGKLQSVINKVEKQGAAILLGYGLCGRTVEGVVSSHSTLILPRVDDCVGALLGSRSRHKAFMKEQAGCYFMAPSWLDTEANLFSQFERELQHLPTEKRDRIIRLALKHYTALVHLVGETREEDAAIACRSLARNYGLGYRETKIDSGLLVRLINGPWSEDEFVRCPPGVPIPLF